MFSLDRQPNLMQLLGSTLLQNFNEMLYTYIIYK